MDISLFDFNLPKEQIALRPANPRDSARLLRVDDAGLFDHRVFELDQLLRPGDVLVSNDTRVIPARLFGRKGEAKIEVTLHRRLDDQSWIAFARPAKKCKIGDQIDFDGLIAEVKARDGAEVTLHFPVDDLDAALEHHGVMPLPPYIAAQRPVDARDLDDYQTIFNRKAGAVAAPTAGLHFTPGLLAALEARGVLAETLTLHVGAGTFLPVKVEDSDDHKMHSEWGEITAETAQRLNAARAAGGRIIAVGTTSLRLLESAADRAGIIHPYCSDTDIFITPGYRFRAVDVLLTNFHLPKSTLFMLVSAFSGLDRMKAAYDHAIRSGYRFYSYGDACLLFPQTMNAPQ
ncbi:S-adenosylmethionine:tRNA ribosyltransferase-isomerase [alpha proteobacterium Q-1]|nr:S-adenosylmethionine:tRNA ribosyltransferase-isomerase [alpha proteobacterium Q-1]